jgi:hypothetical protein
VFFFVFVFCVESELAFLLCLVRTSLITFERFWKAVGCGAVSGGAGGCVCGILEQRRSSIAVNEYQLNKYRHFRNMFVGGITGTLFGATVVALWPITLPSALVTAVVYGYDELNGTHLKTFTKKT